MAWLTGAVLALLLGSAPAGVGAAPPEAAQPLQDAPSEKGLQGGEVPYIPPARPPEYIPPPKAPTYVPPAGEPVYVPRPKGNGEDWPPAGAEPTEERER